MKLSVFFLTLFIAIQSAASNIQVVGLFSNKALVMINGKRHLLSTGGQAVNGIKLLSANSKSAILEVDGKTQTFQLGRDLGNGIQAPKKRVVNITRNNRGQYITRVRINRQSIDMLVDTGANVMAISSADAKRLGLNYKSGEPVRVKTASQLVTGFRINLQQVSIGGIAVNHVEATILEGTYPETALLGMSFLRHVKLSENGGVMQIEAGF